MARNTRIQDIQLVPKHPGKIATGRLQPGLQRDAKIENEGTEVASQNIGHHLQQNEV